VVLPASHATRLRAIDWLRGLVIVLMTVDHAGMFFDAAHMHGDSGVWWAPGSPLPAGEFLTRWITHLCAPTFVLLAGVSLALSDEKRRGQLGQTRFIVTRGLLIAALDPTWMSIGFAGWSRVICQVLYAIGMAMVCMAALRRLSSRALFVGALVIQLFGELTSRYQPTVEPLHSLWAFLFTGGAAFGPVRCSYPLAPWLSIMMFGWVLGRWLVRSQDRGARLRALVGLGIGLLVVFVVVRAIDGYGNWNLHRDSLDLLQWLHVNKYPPSLTYTTLELGIALLLLAALTALDDPRSPRRGLSALALLGSTAFFYYLLHVHLLHGAQIVLGLDPTVHGLAATWIAAAAALAVLAWPCVLYRRYKRAHPDSWTRYL
jgi:uncharacterized membrane protein